MDWDVIESFKNHLALKHFWLTIVINYYRFFCQFWYRISKIELQFLNPCSVLIKNSLESLTVEDLENILRIIRKRHPDMRSVWYRSNQKSSLRQKFENDLTQFEDWFYLDSFNVVDFKLSSLNPAAHGLDSLTIFTF